MKVKEHKLTKRVYTEQAEKEWKRLIRDPYHKLEFDTTIYFLKKYLPKKGLILDAGGGPGRYTIELAKMGYDVVLLDLIPKHLEIARKEIKKAGVEKNVKAIIEGTITDLSKFPSNTFDGVLCLGGPLSHVAPEKNREKTAKELARVAKKSSPVIVSVMGRIGVLLKAPYGWVGEISLKNHFARLSLKGDDYKWHGKYFSHFFNLSELKKLFQPYLNIINQVGLEGISTPHKDAVNELYKNKKAWKNWMKAHYELCTNPTIADLSAHIMLIGIKK